MRKKLLFNKGILPTYQFFHNLVMRAAVGSNVNLPNIFSLNHVLLQRLHPKCHARMCAQQSADVDDKEATIFEAHSVNLLVCP